MTETEKMTLEVNEFLRLLGDEPLNVPAPDAPTSELAFLRQVKEDVYETSSSEGAEIQSFEI